MAILSIEPLAPLLSRNYSIYNSIVANQDLPLQEKVVRIGKEVHERIQPLLDSTKKGLSEVLARSKPQVNGVNGHGTTTVG